MDLVSGAAGIGAGMVLEGIGAAIVTTFALPEIAVGVGIFAVGVGVGVLIDYGTDAVKSEYYRRKR
ncbi:hypothetical protein SAMN02745134_02922 [Clostridium acidisoli DSM 12555]|uniref:Uncharacterized protein n=1 Tax=Clostridium acidisoli DSM 12555 TaxID=1121291 RepID=A0A1W1XSB6_9CLOT|nr:hypothetical protein [Clostridium acidisoli]SMC26742.1 hypothetical protein SAMN02745134_02922 [Clostridium acidisoli DSM 12555]